MHPLWHLSPTARLIAVLARRPEAREPVSGASIVLADPADRGRFLLLARELGVEGLVLSALRKESHLLVPDVAAELDTRLAQLRTRAMLWDLERERILLALEREGVRPILLKGSALREIAYAETFERSMGDLDLLVHASELDHALIALRRSGYSTDSEEVMEAYRLHHFHYMLNHPRGFIVELHWALSEPRAHSGLNDAVFMSRATTWQRGSNVPVRLPAPEDLLLHVISQNAGDALGVFRRIVDVDRIVSRLPGLDWAYIDKAAKDADLDVVLAVTLRLAQLLLQTEVPVGVASGSDVPFASRINIAMLQPVSWVLSLPATRRHVAIETVQIWSTMLWRRRLELAVRAPGESDPLAAALEGKERPERRSLIRLAGLTMFHIQVYARSIVAIMTPSGRSRLRFWSSRTA